jgi:hypothetical protein
MRTGGHNGDGVSDIPWIDKSGNVEAPFINGARASSRSGVGRTEFRPLGYG